MKVSRKDSSSSIILPDDLVFQILLRLPVASLLRFKSVSKYWLCLIESSQFISQHTRRRATLEDEESKLVVLNLTGDMNCPFRHDFVSVLDLQLSTQQVNFQLREESERIEEYKLVASFDGIICLTHRVLTRYIEILDDGEEDGITDWFTVVTLWNPATKQVKILPPPALAAVDHYGLGFKVETNDYRVVRIIEYENGSASAEVYSLNEDCWRPIDAVVPLNHFNCIKSCSKKPFGDRYDNYCWVGWDSISHSSFILHFNFSTEELNIVPSDQVFEDTLPPYEELECYQILGILSEKLACMNRVRNSVNYRYNIWVMDGEQMSWTKRYTFLLDPQICPIGFSVDGKMILKKIQYPRKLFLSDPASAELIDTPFQGSFSEAAVYKESLVSVKGANGETYRLDSEWEAISSTWDLIVSQTIMASSERLAPILDQDPGSLVIFDEPNTVPHFPAHTIFPPRWSPLYVEYIKLNTDAVWKSSSKLGTYGWVARNEAGVAVKAACSNPFPMPSILTGHAEAVRNALHGATNARWSKIIIESDCLPLVDMINGPNDPNSSVSSIVADIKGLRKKFKSILFHFVPISLNAVAHTLAFHGFMYDMPCTWGLAPGDAVMPDWLSDVLAKDVLGP